MSNTSYTPDQQGDFDSPSHSQREPWENYVQFNPEDVNNAASPGQAFSEILFNKPKESPERMEEEEPVTYNEDDSVQKFMEECDFGEDMDIKKQDSVKQQSEPDDTAADNDNSECSRCCSDEEEEDLGSLPTEGSLFHDFSTIGDDAMSCNFDDDFTIEQGFDLDTDFKRKALELIEDRPNEEKQYINLVMPFLVSSLKEIWEKSRLALTDDVIVTIIKDLLYSKELLVGNERQALGSLVEKEMEEQRNSRPESMVTENELVVKKRKEKKISKGGNRNTSTLNHLNENYVSNVFQFARRNYPQDKEVQKIGNERNVSASNFRSLMAAKLTDGIMVRKAKARMIGSGRELIGNIEYWMKDGYFDQCNDREKYILHKEKALRDLALSGHY